jgi:hypothetical protein
MDLIRSLFGHEDGAEPVEPNLPPEIQELYRKLSPAERRRLVRKAEEEAAASQRVNPSRDFAAARDAWIQLELDGGHQALAAAAIAEAADQRKPGARKLHWAVLVGQDDPPDGLWGWMIIEAHKWPAAEIARVPVAFATREEAREAGEIAADKLWDWVNRRLSEGYV